MNDNNFLSLGNVINVIKNISNNNSAMQTEIFCSIFGINNVNTTTINNYCIGIRAIGLEYKKLFQDKYDNNDLINNVLSIVSLLDDKVYNDENSLSIINNSPKLKKVVNELLTLCDSDEYIEDKSIFIKDSLYETFISLLYYAILENKQPIYTQDINIKINKKELNEYLSLKLFWGQNYISSLINLANKNNMYACADLGSLEYDGYVSGIPNYKKSYEYYLKAANKDHPKGCWIIAHMILNKKVDYDFETLWKYLQKSIKLGSAAGYNTLGLCYLRGITKDNKINVEKAKYYFELSSELGYSYAFNNLGKIYEKDNFEEAIKYYKISADMNNSWALNKVGEYYRIKGDTLKAKMYYEAAIECPINEVCYYAYYNLATYYNINKNEYLKIAKKNGIE